jgi:hypothetical protein
MEAAIGRERQTDAYRRQIEAAIIKDMPIDAERGRERHVCMYSFYFAMCWLTVHVFH